MNTGLNNFLSISANGDSGRKILGSKHFPRIPLSQDPGAVVKSGNTVYTVTEVVPPGHPPSKPNPGKVFPDDWSYLLESKITRRVCQRRCVDVQVLVTASGHFVESRKEDAKLKSFLDVSRARKDAEFTYGVGDWVRWEHPSDGLLRGEVVEQVLPFTEIDETLFVQEYRDDPEGLYPPRFSIYRSQTKPRNHPSYIIEVSERSKTYIVSQQSRTLSPSRRPGSPLSTEYTTNRTD